MVPVKAIHYDPIEACVLNVQKSPLQSMIWNKSAMLVVNPFHTFEYRCSEEDLASMPVSGACLPSPLSNILTKIATVNE